LGHVETDLLAFVETAVAFTDDRGVVNENVATGIVADEAKPFLGIEPLYCSLTHALPSFPSYSSLGSCWIRNAVVIANEEAEE
jgi:hypothetical protein